VHAPRGRGPFPNWAAAAIDAYKIDHLDQVGADNWFWERACYEEELFNGFGYRGRGVHGARQAKEAHCLGKLYPARCWAFA
jgi:lysozyme family protein